MVGKEGETMKQGRMLMLLHLVLACYSLSGVCSKLAAREPFLSFHFCLYYGGMIVLLGLYALVWQQIIKRLPLTTAFANKAVTVVWGLVWGVLIFNESITLGKLVGVILVVTGIVLFAKTDGGEMSE